MIDWPKRFQLDSLLVDCDYNPGMTEEHPPDDDELAGQLVHIHVEPPQGWVSINLNEIWHYRELLYFLAWRDIKVRYKQTALGIAWAVLQPLATMAVFTVVFGLFAQMPSDGMPYPVFVFTALLPWQLFAYALAESSNSIVNNQRLITKIYFPRLVAPISSVLAGLVDFLIALVFLFVLMIIFDVPLTTRVLVLPLFVLVAVASALAVGLWLSALNVKYRDVRHLMPFITQFWFFLTPIAYPASLVPEWLLPLYALNPMVGVVEGFRWSLLGTQAISSQVMSISLVMVILLLAGGLAYFRRMEATFADLM